MKKKLILLAAAAAVILVSTTALAAGNHGDPLISLNYLTQTFLPGLMDQAEDRMDALDEVYRSADSQLDSRASGYLGRVPSEGGSTPSGGASAAPVPSGSLYSDHFAENDCRLGDTYTLGTGAGFLLKEGSATVTHNGAVMDVTDGVSLASGAALTPMHRYVVGAATTASFTVTSQTAVAGTEGYYDLKTAAPQPGAPQPGALPFTDVSESDWFYPAVSYAYAQGLFAGTSPTTFSPNQNVTRGMTVTVLYGLAGRPQADIHNRFLDVPATEYYASPVTWATGNGVAAGTAANLFTPNANITREQLACLLFSYAANVAGMDTSARGDLSRFQDRDQISDYAVNAIAWAVDRGIINGLDAVTLAPKGTATRAQLAAMLNAFHALF